MKTMIAAVLLFCFVGCSGMPANVEHINLKCPITDDPASADSVVEFEGQKVGFCCENCAVEWSGQSVDDKRRSVRAMLAMKK